MKGFVSTERLPAWLLPLVLVLGLLFGTLGPVVADGDHPADNGSNTPPAEEVRDQEPDTLGAGEERDGDPDEDEVQVPFMLEILRWLERILDG